MRLPRDPEFVEQWRRLDFRFCCEDCTHLDRATDRCVHGWPAQEHHAAHYARDVDGDGDGGGSLVFCKEFELL